MILDLPFLPSIDALAETDPGLRYVVARIRVDDDNRYLFACRIAGEPPVFGLCSNARWPVTNSKTVKQ